MRACILTILFAGGLLAACDTRVDEPPDPDVIEWRSLAACLDVPGTPVLFVGGPYVTCLSEAGVFESEFSSNGFLSGGFYPFRTSAQEMLIRLNDRDFGSQSFKLNLKSGLLINISSNNARHSHISQVGDGRFIVTDYIDPVREGDRAEFVFSMYDGNRTIPLSRITTNITDDLGISFASHDVHNNRSTVLLIGSNPGQLELEVEHRTGSYRTRRGRVSNIFGTAQYRSDSKKLLMSIFTRNIISDYISGPVAYDFGPSGDSGRRELVSDRRGDVYTFVNGPVGSQIVRLLPGNRLEEVATLPRVQRFMSTSAVRDVACLREFWPPNDFPPPTYDDVVTVISLTNGAVLSTYRVTLDTQKYEAPPFACL